MERPLRQQVLTLAPGQRADVLVDLSGFAAGTEVHLDSQAFAEADAGVGGMMGIMGGRMMGMRGGRSNVPNGTPLRVMTLRTRARKGLALRVPERLSSLTRRGRRAPTHRSGAFRCRFSRWRGRLGVARLLWARSRRKRPLRLARPISGSSSI